MSVQDQLDRISGKIRDSYAAVADMGGTIPAEQRVQNLPEAIRSIPAGGSADGSGEYVPVPGPAGTDGKSAYELAVEQGFVGTLNQWLASLVGPQGERGANGADGYSPVLGRDYFTDADKNAIVSSVLTSLPVYAGEVQ